MEVKAEQFQEACAQLALDEELYRRFPEPWVELRVTWLRGDIAAGQGDTAAAERAYRETRDGFVAQGIGYDAAMVSLDLALLERRARSWSSSTCSRSASVAGRRRRLRRRSRSSRSRRIRLIPLLPSPDELKSRGARAWHALPLLCRRTPPRTSPFQSVTRQSWYAVRQTWSPPSRVWSPAHPTSSAPVQAWSAARQAWFIADQVSAAPHQTRSPPCQAASAAGQALSAAKQTWFAADQTSPATD